jgi:drug/metabolite transporter (DMT)-like permease
MSQKEPHMQNQQLLGVLFGISAGAMWAIEAILGKFLFQSLTFLQIAASEAFFASLICFLYILIQRKRPNQVRSNMGKILVLGLIGTVLAPLLYFLGLSQTLAINATLIAHLQPLFVAYFSYFFLKEHLHSNDYLAGGLVLLAVIFITGRSLENLSALHLGTLGDVIVFFAMLSWAIVAIPGKVLTRQMGSIMIVFLRFIVASSVFLPTLILVNQFTSPTVLQAVLGALVGFGYILYYEGLKRIKASQLALTELSAPFFAMVLAYYFLGEATSLLQGIGMVLLFLGLYLLTRNPGPNSTVNSSAVGAIDIS